MTSSKTTNVLMSIAAAVVSAAVIGMFAQTLSYSEWRGQVTQALAHDEAVEQNVRTALTVLGDHGTELQQLRGQIEGVRGELIATRTELLGVVRESSLDRFKGKDWKREEKLLEMRFQALEREVAMLKTVVTDIRGSLGRIEKKLDNGGNGGGG